MKYSTIAILYNPNSTGSSDVLAKKLKDDLHARLPKQKIQLIATKHAGHGEELAYSIAKESAHPLIISSSGDGGYHEVINGLLKAQREGATPIAGLLPAGNANDHYHNLHEEDVVDVIIKGSHRNIDVLKLIGTSKGKAIERFGHSYIGFGLTPHVGKELNKTKLNVFNQIWIVAKSLMDLQPVRLVVNNKSRLYDSIILSNIDKMSKVLKVSQPSRVTDGKFEVTIFRRRNKLKLIILLFKTSLVGVKEDAQVTEFSLRTVNKTLVQIDGEITNLDEDSLVTISIEKQLLNCIV